jgi:hypothetical protein
MNPINIARGLIDRFDQVKDSDPEQAADIRAQLETMADEVREAVQENRGLVDPATIEVEDKQGGGRKRIPSVAAAEIQLVGKQLEHVLSGARSVGPAPKRTTKAAEPPNRT